MMGSSPKDSSSKKSRCRPSVICAVLSAIVGVGFIVAGILVVLFFKGAIDSIIKSRLPLKERSEMAASWMMPPVTPLLRLYFFNVTNPEQFLQGEKPKLREVGPYVYEEVWEKVNVSWSNGDSEVDYAQKKTFYFNRNLSVGPESDIVTIPNVPMIASVAQMRHGGKLLRIALGSMLEILHQDVFVKVSVKDVIWGYDHPLIKLGNDVLAEDKRLPFDEFGFFVGKNGTSGGMLQALTGIHDLEKLGKVLSFKGKPSLDIWKDECNEIRGTDGTIFHPDVQRNETMYIFSPDLCQSLPLVYKEDVEIKGIPALRFVPPSNVFGTVEENPSNACYCLLEEGCQTPSGLFNMSACQYGSPILLSWPHFFQGDPKLVEAVEGLKPEEEKHQFLIDIQPKLGIGLRAAVRTQINVAMNAVEDIPQAKGVRDIIFPVLWFQDGIDEIDDEATTDQIFTAIKIPEIIRQAMYPTLFGFGILILILVFLFSLKVCFKQDHRAPHPDPMNIRHLPEQNGNSLHAMKNGNSRYVVNNGNGRIGAFQTAHV